LKIGRAKPDYATMPFGDILKCPVAKFADAQKKRIALEPLTNVNHCALVGI
jgi:hypothetical protein